MGDGERFFSHIVGFHRTGGAVSPGPATVYGAKAEGQGSPHPSPGQCWPSAALSAWLSQRLAGH